MAAAPAVSTQFGRLHPVTELAHVTPLWESGSLSRAAGTRVLLKMEALQPVGSFKIRGVERLCRRAVDEGTRHLVCASGGNAGFAVAYAARRFGVMATIFVPETTPEHTRDGLRAEGAEVVEAGHSWDDAHEVAADFATRKKTTYVHPFDHPDLWAGHSTMIDELAAQGPEPGAIICSVGGGGLLCGVLEGIERQGWSEVPVIAVETEGAQSFARSVEARAPIVLDRIDSLATTLGARRIASEALARAARFQVRSEIVTDAEAVTACRRFADEHRILVEPACGAALAVVTERLVGPGPIVVIVCGGAGASPALLAEWERRVRE